MKGISLTSLVRQTLSHNILAKMVIDAKPIRLPQMQFKKNIKKQSMETRDLLKRVSFISNKRRFIPDSARLDTLPYGFRS